MSKLPPSTMSFLSTYGVLVLPILLSLHSKPVASFVFLQIPQSGNSFASRSTGRSRLNVVSDIRRPPTFLDDENDADEDDDGFSISFLDETSSSEDSEPNRQPGQGRKRWESLNPRIKKRLIKQGQASTLR